MRIIASTSLPLIVALLAGCAVDAPPETPSAKSSTSWSPPTSTSSPAPSRTAAAEPSASETESAQNELSLAGLADICVVSVQETGDSGTDRPDSSGARAQLVDDTLWAVAVPVVEDPSGSPPVDIAYFCKVVGTYDSFQVELHARTRYKVGDDWLQVLTEVENGTR